MYKVILILEFVSEILKCGHSNAAIKKHFHVVMFLMLYKVILFNLIIIIIIINIIITIIIIIVNFPLVEGSSDKSSHPYNSMFLYQRTQLTSRTVVQPIFVLHLFLVAPIFVVFFGGFLDNDSDDKRYSKDFDWLAYQNVLKEGYQH